MAKIELTANTVTVQVEGADQIWSLKSRLEIPLTHVVSAEIDPETEQEWHKWFLGWRAPGAHLPGVIAAGTFYQHGERVFWDVHHPEKAITLRLTDERYARLVVEVDDPAATVAAIQQAIGSGPA